MRETELVHTSEKTNAQQFSGLRHAFIWSTADPFRRKEVSGNDLLFPKVHNTISKELRTNTERVSVIGVKIVFQEFVTPPFDTQVSECE